MRERIEPVGPTRRFGPGIGFNWFDYLGMGGSYAHPPEYYPLDAPCYPPLEDEVAWGAILTDTVHLRRLDRIAGWAARRGCTVLLDTFLLPARHELPLPTGAKLAWDGGMYQLGARDNRAYAREFMAPLLRHVVLDRGLAAVRLFNPVNEPMAYGVYQMPEGAADTCVHYVEMYREMRSALDAAGLPRERVGLVGCVRLPGRQPREPAGGDHDPRRDRQAHRDHRRPLADRGVGGETPDARTVPGGDVRTAESPRAAVVDRAPDGHAAGGRPPRPRARDGVRRPLGRARGPRASSCRR